MSIWGNPIWIGSGGGGGGGLRAAVMAIYDFAADLENGNISFSGSAVGELVA